MTIAWALSGGGSKGDFEVGAVRCLTDLSIVPAIVSSTSVGSVSALKIAEGPQGIPGLQNVWLSLMGNGDMFGREAWTTDPDLEEYALSIGKALISLPPPSPFLADIEAIGLLEQAIDMNDPVTGETDISPSGIAAVSGFVPILGLLISTEINKLERLKDAVTHQQAVFNPNPTRELVRANLRQDLVAVWGAQGNRLRLAMVGLVSGKLRYLTETGRMVERDGATSIYDHDTGFEVHSTYLTGMMASASIPAIFPPVVIADDAYVDGGIREQIPIEVAVLLGATRVYAIFSDARDVERDPSLKQGTLLSIAARALMGLAINELTYSDTFHAGGWGPGVEMKVIQPRVDVHGAFTIYPAFVRNRMTYGYLCAADIVQPAAGNQARCQVIADEIAVLRYGAARLEAWLEGRRVPPTLISLARPSGVVRNKVRQGIYRLKLRIHALAKERAQLGGMMPPQDGSWTDSNRWWQGWERHPLLQLEQAPQTGEVCAISSSPNHLHVFVVTADQRVMTASWNPESGEGWEGWFQVAGVDAALSTSQPGSPIHATSRHNGSFDLMIAGTQGEVRTAQWDRQFQVDDGWNGWHDWSQVGTGRTAQHGAVTATSRRTDFLDIFTVGTDRHVWTNAMDTSRQWGAWRMIGSLQTADGAPVHAVSRKLDNLDIFVTDASGSIQWSHWDPSLSSWTAWSII
ncbi:MAG: patatin-like phospholipase family protein [Acidobacteriia bacterium]|nr:patatin-like phospholipase family protein [Terriglobia bacterium]